MPVLSFSPSVILSSPPFISSCSVLSCRVIFTTESYVHCQSSLEVSIVLVIYMVPILPPALADDVHQDHSDMNNLNPKSSHHNPQLLLYIIYTLAPTHIYKMLVTNSLRIHRSQKRLTSHSQWRNNNISVSPDLLRSDLVWFQRSLHGAAKTLADAAPSSPPPENIPR